VLQQPPLDGGRLVRGVVVHDQMDGELGRDLTIDAFEELPELARSVPAMTRADHLTRDEVEGREQRGRAVAAVVVGPPLGDPRSQGKDWLGAIEGLDLRLLIDAEDGGGIWRVQMEQRPAALRLDQDRRGDSRRSPR